MTRIEQVRGFLQKYLPQLVRDSGGGPCPQIPEFDLYASDYLGFAEESLNRYLVDRRAAELLNCLSHLKRAMDCQIDVFLHAYGLADVFNKRNLGVGKKLRFIQACGVYSSRTLERLNTFRNRMEHRFEIPEIADIEVYFDLVSAFVALVQAAISVWVKQYFLLPDPEDPKRTCGRFSVTYDSDTPQVTVEWRVGLDVVKIESTPVDIDEFAFMMKVLFLLRTRDSYASDNHILKQL